MAPGAASEPARAGANARRGDPRTRDPVRRALAACPELDCVRHRLAPAVAATAEARAAELGIGAERVLIATRAITEDAYVVALAASLRLPFEPLTSVSRANCPLTDPDIRDADRNGLLPLVVDGQRIWAIAPLTVGAYRLVAIARANPSVTPHIRLTSTQRLRKFVTMRATEAWASTRPKHYAQRAIALGRRPRRAARIDVVRSVRGDNRDDRCWYPRPSSRA